MYILGIETSCDETAASIIDEGFNIKSNIISSQIEIHKKFGGVVPELASRNHLIKIKPVLEESLESADINLDDVSLISVTKGPGLIGALLVGVQFAKSMSFSKNIPMIGINHLQGHLSAIFLEQKTINYPAIGLVVSGGHTNLYLLHKPLKYELIGQSLDDAAGEAFDKVAKMLGLEYPGGISIEKRSQNGKPDFIRFPRALPGNKIFNFSFSGVKTSVMNYINKNNKNLSDSLIDNICASFQAAVVDVLVKKSISAAKEYKAKQIIICGGVAANTCLRETLISKTKGAGISTLIPSRSLCTDNAAMIAAAGYNIYKNTDNIDYIDMSASSTLKL